MGHVTLTTHLSLIIYHLRLGLTTDAKCRKWGALRWIEVTQGHRQCHSIERIQLPIVYEMQQAICRNLPILPTTPAFSALVEETPVEFQDDLRLTDGQMDGNQTQDNSIYHAIRARTVKTWSKLRILTRPSFLDCVRLNRRSPCNFACNYC